MLQKRVEVPVQLLEGFAFVPATIGSAPVTLLLDTGAQGMLLTPDAVGALDLPVDPRGGTRLLGTGGSREAANVILRGFKLGGVEMAFGSVPVAAVPGVPRTVPPLAGLLGAPALAFDDVDLDVPRGRLTLYDAPGCNATLPLVAPPFSVLPLEVSPYGEAFIPVRVNGQDLLALIDTGSRSTLMTERAAQRLGLEGPSSANVARGVDGTAMPVRHFQVRSLQVGAEVLANTPVSVSPLQLDHGDMLLGLDYLRDRRVWISYRTGRVIIGAAKGR